MTEAAQNDTMSKLTAARWIATRSAALRFRFQLWRQESWIAACITTVSIAVVVGNALFGVLDKKDEAVKLLGLDKCYIFDPATGAPDTSKERPCLPGEATFIKWQYPNLGDGDDDDVFDCANRTFQVVKVNGGQVEWGEQRLRRAQDRTGTVACKDR